MNIHIFSSPEEAMLENWQKLDFNTKYFLFWEKSEPSSSKNKLWSSSCFATLKDKEKWSEHGKMIAPLENFYIRKTFYPRG